MAGGSVSLGLEQPAASEGRIGGRPVRLLADEVMPDMPLLYLFPADDVMWMVVAADEAIVEEAMAAVAAEGGEEGEERRQPRQKRQRHGTEHRATDRRQPSALGAVSGQRRQTPSHTTGAKASRHARFDQGLPACSNGAEEGLPPSAIGRRARSAQHRRHGKPTAARDARC